MQDWCNFTDLVQEERSAVGHLESADPLRHRAGEGASFVAKQFALQQRGGNRGAVQGDEWTIAPLAGGVDGARDQLFSGSGFALDEHRGIGGRNQLELLENGL